MKNFIRKIFDLLLTLVIIILVGYFVLRIFNVIKIFHVETGSMEDKIHAGDYILLCKKEKYYVGDVVTYRVKDYYVTHRIINIENNQVTTKGDANNVEDEKININQIEGKAICWGGFLNLIINFKYVIVIILIGLYLLDCYYGAEAENAKKEIIDEEEQNDIKLNKAVVKDKDIIIEDVQENDILEIEKNDELPKENIEAHYEEEKKEEQNIEVHHEEEKKEEQNIEVHHEEEKKEEQKIIEVKESAFDVINKVVEKEEIEKPMVEIKKTTTKEKSKAKTSTKRVSKSKSNSKGSKTTKSSTKSTKNANSSNKEKSKKNSKTTKKTLSTSKTESSKGETKVKKNNK